MCDEKGVAAFQLLRPPRGTSPRAFLYAFDLLELNDTDLRKEPIESAEGHPGEHPAQGQGLAFRLNDHLEHPEGTTVFRHGAMWAWTGIVSKEPRIALLFGPIAGLAPI